MMTRFLCLITGLLFTLVIEIYSERYPNFPTQAEFIIESIINDGQHPRTLVECIYDYDNNRFIINTRETFEYHNYSTLKKSVYLSDNLKQCDVYPIDLDNPLDGFSAMSDPDDSTTHIRPLYDLFLLTSNATYIGEAVLRGSIYVNQWLSSESNDSDIIWSFAKSTYVMPWYDEGYDVPIQRIKKRKDDGTIFEVLNVFSYQTMISEKELTPPKGIYCENLVPPAQLLSLQDNGIQFPNKFSIRIDASTSTQQLWRSAHLRYHQTTERKLIRYDYTPSDNGQNPVSIILEYADNALRSYTIDRRTGSCVIDQTVEIMLMTSILHNPIETLIKYENFLLSNPPRRMFQFSGRRACRGSLLCSIFIGQENQWPIDTNEDWFKTSIEWGWSKTNIGDENAPFDYPVYLDLNLYRDPDEPPANVHYEFYDYRTDVHINEFDVNLCYRSNQLSYQHLAFQLKINGQTATDELENNLINRRRIMEFIRGKMIDIMRIKYLRISQLELDHQPELPGHNNTLYCIFTLLDRTPFVDPNTEVELLDAQQSLEAAINKGEFKFTTDNGLVIEAVPKSLENIEYFYVFNPNGSINQIDYFVNTTIHINRTSIITNEKVYEKIEYSDGATAGAIVGGLIVGILFGTFLVLGVTHTIKRKSTISTTGGLTFNNISFHAPGKKNQHEQATVTLG